MTVPRTIPRVAAAFVLTFAALLTAACAGSPGTTPTTGGADGSGVPSTPVATPGPTDSGTTAQAPTCETIIPDTTVQDFTSLGWTAMQEPFPLGETQLTGGLQCTWGDYSVASDHVQVFGWAPLTDDQAVTARGELLSSGWREIEDGGAVYITENPDTAVATDDDGYGLTYLFGDGWVELADTKQSLLLVEWPRL